MLVKTAMDGLKERLGGLIIPNPPLFQPSEHLSSGKIAVAFAPQMAGC
jgi:hypothetical protein